LDDVRAALQYLAAEFPGTLLLVAGFSFGCWVGMRAGCGDGRVEKLIGIGAPVNNSDFSYLAKCAKPKLFVHGSNDEHGDVEKVRQMIASLPGENELTVVDGVDHFFTGKIEELGKAIRDWLQPAMHNIAQSRARD
jgi:alpha/beta superfamily hydrolase